MIPFKSIRVGPFDIALTQLEGKSRDNNMGEFCDTQLTISMREHYNNPQQEAETLLHELLHAIYEVMGVRSKDGEERIISQMSLGMASVIRDNPTLIDWLKEKLS